MAIESLYTFYTRIISGIKKFLHVLRGSASCGSSAFTTPITISILSPEHYGLLALLNSFVGIACIVCGLDLRQALFLEYFYCSTEQKQ
jgi:O-antigen/teichoic acid export membrane protein